MRHFFLYNIIFLFSAFFACSDKKTDHQIETTPSQKPTFQELGPEFTDYHVIMTGFDSIEFNKHYKNRIEPPQINLNQSLEGMPLSALIILKNTILAMKGNLFEDAILSRYFSKFSWYQPPFWDTNFSIKLNDAEALFTKRIDYYISELRKENYRNGTIKMPNVQNIANSFQWDNFEQETSSKLAKNGFVIVPSHHNQLFDLYEQNQLDHLPSFITTDLILQQLHLFYGMLENEIEEQYLIEILQSMLEIINQDLYSSYEKTLDPQIEKSIEENLLYYSIPYAVITNKKNNLIGDYNEIYFEELGKVLAGQGLGSKIMGNDDLDYTVFKPIDHYTKNERTQHYFKALTWLQKVSLCLSDEKDFSNALLIANMINRKSELKDQYNKFIEYKTYFSSQKQQFTLWDLANILSEIKKSIQLEDLFDETLRTQIKSKLKLIDGSGCQLTVSLMPQEYQNLFTDLGIIEKGFKNPSTTDLFAALGNPAAIALSESVSGTNAENYLKSITENLVTISGQEDAISMDWLSTQLTSYNTSSSGQEYMGQNPWKRRELNSALASWIQLDERINLEADGIKKEQNDQTNFPNTVLKGYVEPNTNFWQSASTLLNNTRNFLTDRKILSGKSDKNLTYLQDMIDFLNEVSKKEIKNDSIDAQSYARIASIGTECHDFTLGLINPNFNTKYQRIRTPMAFATPVFHGENKNNFVGGVGFGNTILVLVEIDEFIYLTKGAVYSYYEMENYPKSYVDKREWIEILNNNKYQKRLSWMIDLLTITNQAEVLEASN